MPLGPPPNIAAGVGLVTQPIKLDALSRPALVTFTLFVAGVPSLAVAQDAIDDFQNAWVVNIAGDLDDNVLSLAPSIRLGDGTTVPYEAIAGGAPTPGTDVAVANPPNVSLLVKKNTGAGGRANRGRSYIPWILPDADVDEAGNVLPARVTALQGDFNAFLAQLIADGNPMYLSHKVFSAPPPPLHVTNILLGRAVTSYTVETTIATQRRRLGR